MSRTKLLTLLFSILLLFNVSACGFEPLYHSHNDYVRYSLASIKVDKIPGRVGQQLIYYLYDLFNPTQEPIDWHYNLKIKLAKSNVSSGIKRDASITRYNIIISADYTLHTMESNELVDKGNIKIISSYDSANSQYATFVAENDAQERAIKGLGEELRVRLASAILNRDEE